MEIYSALKVEQINDHLKRSSSTDHSLLSLYALPLMSVLWFIDPAMFFIPFPFSLLSFTVTSFIASV